MSDKAITRAEFEAFRKPPTFATFNPDISIYVSTFSVTKAEKRRVRDYNRMFRQWQAAKEQYAPREAEIEQALQSLIWAVEHNTGREPSVSCFSLAIDEAKALIVDKE